MRLLFDIVVKLYHCLTTLAYIDQSGCGVTLNLPISGRHFVLSFCYLDRLIFVISQVGGREAALAPLQQAKKFAARMKAIADFCSSAPGFIYQLCVRAAGAMLTCNS